MFLATHEASIPACMGRYVRAPKSLATSTALFHSDECGHYPFPPTLWVVLVVFLFSSVGQDSSRTCLDATRRQGSEADSRRFSDPRSSSLLGTGNVEATRWHTLGQLLPVSQMTEDLSVSPEGDDLGKTVSVFYFSRAESNGHGDNVHRATLHPR